MLHAGEAFLSIFPIHCSLKAVWSLYVPGPSTFKIAGFAPAEVAPKDRGGSIVIIYREVITLYMQVGWLQWAVSVCILGGGGRGGACPPNIIIWGPLEPPLKEAQ